MTRSPLVMKPLITYTMMILHTIDFVCNRFLRIEAAMADFYDVLDVSGERSSPEFSKRMASASFHHSRNISWLTVVVIVMMKKRIV